jgi:hypothetical protein
MGPLGPVMVFESAVCLVHLFLITTMCLFPLLGGPLDVPVIPTTPLYQQRYFLGIALTVVASLHLCVGISWMVCFQWFNGVLDILSSVFGLFAARPTNHNLLCLFCYGMVCVPPRVISFIFFLLLSFFLSLSLSHALFVFFGLSFSPSVV